MLQLPDSEQNIQQHEALILLYKSSLGSIPFNIALATFLAVELLYHNVSYNLKHIIATADKALYQAKRKGKNQVVVLNAND